MCSADNTLRVAKAWAIVATALGASQRTGEGAFFQGSITSGVPLDDAGDALQANIVTAGYGH
jgi:hypothetical protein